ncbi:MAG: PAS domain S-box protein [Spirulina sp. DLM2.Bin59]|nr:MAG: PAS domain S-box protein [Spirulina sp. DLM2.Bin59]
MAADLSPNCGFADILAQSDLAIAILDHHLHYVWMSQRWQRDYHLTGELGQAYDAGDLTLPASWPPAFAALLEGQEPLEDYAKADPLTYPNGETVWIEWQAKPWFDAHGTLGGILVQSKIIPEPQRHGIAWEEIVNLSPNLICLVNGAGDFAHVNPAWENLLGWSRDELHNSPFIKFIHPEDQERTLALVEALNQGETCISFENRYRCKDGSYLWLAWTAAMMESQGYIYALARDISDRKRTEAARQRMASALRRSEQRYQVLADTAPVGIFHSNLDRQYIYANQQLCSLMGLSLNAIAGEDWMTSIHPQDRDRIAREWQRAQDEGQCFQSECRFLRPDGSVRWVYIQVQNVIDLATNQTGSYVGTCTDLTKRKQAEAALQESEATNKAILTAIPDLMFRLDCQGRYLGHISTSEFQDLMPNDVDPRGQDIRDWMPPEVAHRHYHYGQRALQTGEMQIYEQEIHFDDNHIQYEEVRVIPSGPHELLYIVRDISDRKRIEASLLDFAHRLQAQVEREQFLNRLSVEIRSSLEQSPEILINRALDAVRELFQIDRTHFAWYMTDVAEPYWDVFAESVAEGLPDFRGHYPAHAVGPMAAILLRLEVICIDDASEIADPIYREFIQNLAYRSVLVVPLEVEPGKIGVMICSHSATVRPWKPAEVELVKAVLNQLAIATNQAALYAQSQARAEELRQTLNELNRTQSQLIQTEKMSSLGQLVAGVAHEINNPVNFIYGNIDHARDYINDLLGLIALYGQHYPDPKMIIADEIDAIDLPFLLDDLPKMLQSMRVGAERIKEIVASLRTFSRMDESEMKAVNIHDGIESTLMILHNRLKSKPHSQGIEVIRKYGNLPKVECYAGQLNQVFMNILSNAIDALLEEESCQWDSVPPPSQDSWIEIETHLSTDGEQVMIHIRDNGPGIDPAHQARLFDPFFTTKEIGKGTGLGLAISYQIVTEKHGGQLLCASILGKGTEFTIQIPCRQQLARIQQMRA